MSAPRFGRAPWIQCIPCPVLLVGGLVAFVLMFGWVWLVVSNVLSGSGLAHCCTIGGVAFNYIGAFVFICGTAAALLIAGAIQIRDWLRWRRENQRYGVRSSELERAHRAGHSRQNDLSGLSDADDAA